MRIACIDIGSNTTRLLVAEPAGDGLREVAADRVFNRDAPVGATVVRQLAAAREAGAEEVHVVGTAALREAPGMVDGVGEAVRILSPAEESRLAFLGALGSLDAPPAGPVAVVDAGGGSCEIVCGTADDGVRWAASLPFGSRSLADAHVRGDPPTPAELAAVRGEVTAGFAGVEPPAVSAAYAVGGSATSLRRLVGDVLDHAALARAVGAVCSAPAADVARRFGLHPQRVRVLPAGMLVLEAAAGAVGHSLRIARGGLREGVILERLRSGAR